MLQVVITGIYLFDLFLILQIVNVVLSYFLSALIENTRLVHIMYNQRKTKYYWIEKLGQNSNGYKKQ